MTRPDQAKDPPSANTRGNASPRRISSEQLLDGHRELIIEHGAETYRLLLTRNGKLILIK